MRDPNELCRSTVLRVAPKVPVPVASANMVHTRSTREVRVAQDPLTTPKRHPAPPLIMESVDVHA